MTHTECLFNKSTPDIAQPFPFKIEYIREYQ